MKLRIPAALLDATRLVRGGKLAEATAAIQRALLGDASTRRAPANSVDAGSIEGTCRVLDADWVAPPQRGDAANDGNAGAGVGAPEPGGRFVTARYSNAAGTRMYKTYLPARYKGHAMPLVVMLHGCKQGPDDFAAGTRMNELAEEEGFVVVYPAQAAEANASKCWNWFQAKDQLRDEGEPSVIAGITREVVDAYGLDPRRVYIAGLSAGGAMAAVMGTTYPDVYAAIGVHSGLAYAAAGDLPSAFAAMRGERRLKRRRTNGADSRRRLIPAIVFHGDRDTTVHPSNGEHVIAQGTTARSEDYSADNPAQVQNGSARGRAYTRTTHLDGAGNPVMEHWIVHGAGHAWFGGSSNGSFTDSTGPDASREMLRFFLEHPQHDTRAR
jgi:poly(hydroxyalkanoate) depolymerase family esterase